MVENGAVRTYEGHNNSHTMLQLGVDPTETLLVSGNWPAFLILPSTSMKHVIGDKNQVTTLHVCLVF